MSKIFVLFCIVFSLFSCSSGEESTSVISNELKNNNVQDDVTTQKSKQIRADFEKDLDTLYKTASGETH